MKWIWIGLVIILVVAVGYQALIGSEVKNTDIKIDVEVNAPGFEKGGKWFNSQPLVLKKLMEEKKVVLVDFWTYSCINCQRTIPYLKQWWEKYKDKGLVIVGVHSPEFEFEKEPGNVESAIRRYQVGWPVVMDNEMGIWRAYANRYWPAKYMVVPPGRIVYTHFGEGDYEETENKIREELKKLGYEVEDMPIVKEEITGTGYDISPETYVGYERGRYGNPEQIGADKLKEYEIKGMVKRDNIYLGGEWTVKSEYSLAGNGAVMKYRFKAGEVNLVLRGQGKVEVFIDGEKTKTIEVSESDLYNLYKGQLMEAEMELRFESGVEAYAFTFGQ